MPLNLQHYSILELPKEPFVVIIPKGWRLNFPNPVVKLEELVNYPFMTLAPMKYYNLYENILNQFEKRGLTLNAVLEASDVSTLILFAAAETGISIIPKSDVHLVDNYRVEVLMIEDSTLMIEPAIVWNKDKYQSIAARRYLDHIKEIFA